MKNPDGWKQIGEVGVDSGQLMVCDPCYIDSEWECSEYKDIRLHRHKETGNLYGYDTRECREYAKENKLEVYFFQNYMSVLEDFATPSFHIANGTWEDLETKVDESFSYNGVSHNFDGYKQINYKMGHPGVAVSFRTGWGDGCYPVFARFQHGRVAEVKIVFIEDDEVDLFKSGVNMTSTKLNKKELIEKTVKFYMEMESWDGPEFQESLKEMAVKILSHEPSRLEQLFPNYKYIHPWTVTGPSNVEKLSYIQLLLDEAKQFAIKELMYTEKEALA